MRILDRRPPEPNPREEYEREALPHLDALYALAVRFSRNARDAEDLVQETMLRAYRSWHTFVPGSNCKAWLFRILHNLFVNSWHRARRDRALAQELAEEVAGDERLAAAAPSPAELQRTFSAEVQRALDALPTDYRIAVLLCDLEELTYREIAEVMDCPIGTVMSRLHRGRRALATALREHATAQGIAAPAAEPVAVPATTGSANTVDLARYRRERGLA